MQAGGRVSDPSDEIEVITTDPNALRRAIEAVQVPAAIGWLPRLIVVNLLTMTADAESAFGAHRIGGAGEIGPYQFADPNAYRPPGAAEGWRDQPVEATAAASAYLAEIGGTWPGPVLAVPYAAQTFAREGWRRGVTRATTDEANGVTLSDRDRQLVDDYGWRHELYLAALALAAILTAWWSQPRQGWIWRGLSILAVAAAVSCVVLIILGRAWRTGWWQASRENAAPYSPPQPAPADEDVIP